MWRAGICRLYFPLKWICRATGGVAAPHGGRAGRTTGTSALTGMLRAGLDVPDDLMERPDDVINLKGYWESEGLMQE